MNETNEQEIADMTPNERQTLLKQMAEVAIQIQDASNISGLSLQFPNVVKRVREIMLADGDYSTNMLHKSPIIKMWAAKLHDLCHMGFSDEDAYSEAYRQCRIMASYKNWQIKNKIFSAWSESFVGTLHLAIKHINKILKKDETLVLWLLEGDGSQIRIAEIGPNGKWISKFYKVEEDYGTNE